MSDFDPSAQPVVPAAAGPALLAMFPDVDRAYLERRIRYESAGDHGLEILF